MKNKISPERKAELIDAAKFRLGSVAIFTEHPSYICVRVEEVEADDWGVKLTLAFMDVPGLEPQPAIKARGSLEVSVAWEFGSFSDDWWIAHYVAWNLHFSSELIEHAAEMAKAMVAQGKDFGRVEFHTLRLQHEQKKRALHVAASPTRS
jgi:phenylpyruvate tautomerase PptA (4-oxalocrotonate tautomerase family)